MSHLMTSMTDADGAASEGRTASPEENSSVAPTKPVRNEGDEGETKDGDEAAEEEFIEEEYYEDEEYEEEVEEESIEDVVDDEGEQNQTRGSSQMVDDDSAGESGQGTRQSSDAFLSGGGSSATPSGDGGDTSSSSPAPPPQSDPECFADFADFPPMDEKEHGSNTQGLTEDTGMATFPVTQQRTHHVFADEENQQSAQFVPPVRQAPPPQNQLPIEGRQAPPPDTRAPIAVDKEANKSSHFWYWAVCFLVCALLGVGAYVGWFLVNKDRKSAPNLGQRTTTPTPAPTIGRTTAFDPIQGNCNFVGLRNPSVIDQCLCVGEIQIIPNDVRKRYESRRNTFIPTLYQNYNDTINSCSPHNQALVWISSGNEYDFTYVEKVDRFALATFYAALNGTKWKKSKKWFTDSSACEWEGVRCDSNGGVQIVSLPNNNLQGTMPPEVGLLKRMAQLYVSNNHIEGPIPEGTFTIKPLQVLDFSYNSLTGPVPPMIGSAKGLKQINLVSNLLSGRISQELAGAVSLEVFYVGSNELVGTIPDNLYTLGNLTDLDLSGNQLTGTISTKIGQLRNLTSLMLGPNAFQGEIPTTIGKLSKLKTLVVHDVPQLGGRLPAQYARNLNQLMELRISQTNIFGNIETGFGDLSHLTSLDFSSNQLRGTIPSELGNLGNLTTLNLASNFLEGPIPATLGNLVNLTSLYLNNNVLTGGVPIDFSMLDHLQTLQLDGNSLTGRVPPEICALRSVDLQTFQVDCSSTVNGATVGLICSIPSCCTGCTSNFN